MAYVRDVSTLLLQRSAEGGDSLMRALLELQPDARSLLESLAEQCRPEYRASDGRILQRSTSLIATNAALLAVAASAVAWRQQQYEATRKFEKRIAELESIVKTLISRVSDADKWHLRPLQDIELRGARPLPGITRTPPDSDVFLPGLDYAELFAHLQRAVLHYNDNVRRLRGTLPWTVFLQAFFTAMLKDRESVSKMTLARTTTKPEEIHVLSELDFAIVSSAAEFIGKISGSVEAEDFKVRALTLKAWDTAIGDIRRARRKHEEDPFVRISLLLSGFDGGTFAACLRCATVKCEEAEEGQSGCDRPGSLPSSCVGAVLGLAPLSSGVSESDSDDKMPSWTMLFQKRMHKRSSVESDAGSFAKRLCAETNENLEFPSDRSNSSSSRPRNTS